MKKAKKNLNFIFVKGFEKICEGIESYDKFFLEEKRMDRLHVWIPLFFMVCLIGSISSEPNYQVDQMADPIQIDIEQKHNDQFTINQKWLIDEQIKDNESPHIYLVLRSSMDSKKVVARDEL